MAGLVVLAVAFLSLYCPVRARLAGRRTMRHGREAAAAIFEFLDRKGRRGHLPGRRVPARHPAGDRVRRRDRPRAGHRPPAAQQGQLQGPGRAAGRDRRVRRWRSSSPWFRSSPGSSTRPRARSRSTGGTSSGSRRTRCVPRSGWCSRTAWCSTTRWRTTSAAATRSYTLPQIIEAAKLAHAHQFIQRLPYGYETPIGELGQSLSPGEQFRVALARAILRDPSTLRHRGAGRAPGRRHQGPGGRHAEPRAARQDGDLPAAPGVHAPPAATRSSCCTRAGWSRPASTAS